MKSITKISSIIVGAVFILSGLGKALSLSDFAALISQYSSANLSFLAPIIAIVETAVGMLLVLGVRLKKTTLSAQGMLIGFTAIYIYGYIFKDIEDCGCFGALTALKTSFTITLIRNTILFVLLIFVRQHQQSTTPKLTPYLQLLFIVTLCCVSFISGYSYEPVEMSSISTKKGKYIGQAVQNTILNRFVSTSKDSTYFLFTFMYSCNHCLNSIENLKQYKNSGVAETIIGLTFDNAAQAEFFRTKFNPNFTIQNLDVETLLDVTNTFPIGYYIKNDTIRFEIRGELPSGYVLLNEIAKLKL